MSDEAGVMDGDTAGILLFLVGIFMGPVVAVIASSLRKKHEIARVRTVQVGAIAAFVITSLALLAIFGLSLSAGVNEILFSISALSAIVFMVGVSGLMFVGIMTFTRDTLLAPKQPTQKSTKKKS